MGLLTACGEVGSTPVEPVAFRARDGAVEIATATEGLALDPDGYRIVLGGEAVGRIGTTDVLVFASRPAGELVVKLKDLASNCNVSGDNPQVVDVVPADTVSVVFSVRCRLLSGENHAASGPRPIAFVSDRDFEGAPGIAYGRYDVYLAAPDGGDVVRLTAGVTDVNSASLSPDGTRIAIGEGDRIEILDLAGSGAVTVPVLDRAFTIDAPAWSPDGTRIAFTIDEDGWFDLHVYVVDVDGSNLTPLAEGTSPTWSPDGTRIAFNRMDEDGDEIWVMNADGTEPVNITDSEGNDFQPDWSPDGDRILFTSTRGGDSDVYVMNADGSGQRNLTRHPAFDAQASWSPDGSKIAFFTNRTGNGEIFVMGEDGSDPVNLTRHPAQDQAPDW